jgi:hypothetical protein
MDICHGLLLPKKQSGIVDPYWDNVVLFLKGNGTNNSTNIIDDSPSPKTVTVNGNTKISTAQSKYGGSSILFDGTGDFLSLPATGDMHFTTEPFTWEGWFRFSSLSSTSMALISTARANAGGNFGHFFSATSGEARLRDWVSFNGAGKVGTVINTWQHIACTKSSTTANVWINGVKGSAGTFTATNTPHTDFLIGRVFNNGGFAIDFNGYMNFIRITKGVIRYTTDFNPETDTYMN